MQTNSPTIQQHTPKGGIEDELGFGRPRPVDGELLFSGFDALPRGNGHGDMQHCPDCEADDCDTCRDEARGAAAGVVADTIGALDAVMGLCDELSSKLSDMAIIARASQQAFEDTLAHDARMVAALAEVERLIEPLRDEHPAARDAWRIAREARHRPGQENHDAKP